MKTTINTDNGKVTVNISSLTQLLQIGLEPDPYEEEACDGFFDDQKNFYADYGPYAYNMFPWEWVLFPEIVALATKLGVEVPVDPPFDISKTF